MVRPPSAVAAGGVRNELVPVLGAGVDHAALGVTLEERLGFLPLDGAARGNVRADLLVVDGAGCPARFADQPLREDALTGFLGRPGGAFLGVLVGGLAEELCGR